MSPDEHARLLAAVQGIESDLAEYSAGWQNERAIATITKHIAAIESFVTDPYMREKVASLSGWLKHLFSKNAIREHDADRIKGHIRSDCRNLLTRAKVLPESES